MGVCVRELQKRQNGIEIYNNLTFDVKPGKITAIFGPNGAGKTTLFHLITGIQKLDKGSIICTGGKNKIGFMFQNYKEILLPWKTCHENLAFPLEVEKQAKEKISQKIKTIETNFSLEKYPYELSGGQQQMLALHRTLVTNPNLLLLDEPFSALDYEHALKQRDTLLKYYEKELPSILIITHNIEETVYLSHEIIVLSNKPTKVVGTIQNPLPFPRTREIVTQQEFHKITKQVRTLFAEAMKT